MERCSAVRCSAVPYSAVRYSAVRYSAVRYSAAWRVCVHSCEVVSWTNSGSLLTLLSGEVIPNNAGSSHTYYGWNTGGLRVGERSIPEKISRGRKSCPETHLLGC